MLKEMIEKKLNDCVTVCIIIDVWATLINKDYLWIGVPLSDRFCTRNTSFKYDNNGSPS